MLKMIGKIKTPIARNRFLLVSCLLLIAGMLTGCFGTSIFPGTLKEKLLSMKLFETDNIYYSFADNFIFPFVSFTAIFLSGFSAAGHLTLSFDVILSGIYIGIKNSVLLLKSGALDEVYFKYYFIYLIFICFMLIILSENAYFMSAAVFGKLKGKDTNKAHYEAKLLFVKYVIFTVVSGLISLFFHLK